MKEIIIDGVEYTLTPKAKEELFDDWRLPTIDELGTIRNRNMFNPACDLADCVSNNYWSSTPSADGSDYAWYIHFHFGGEDYYYEGNNGYVRCVREGNNGLEWSATSENKMNWNEAIEYSKNLVAPVYYKMDGMYGNVLLDGFEEIQYLLASMKAERVNK